MNAIIALYDIMLSVMGMGLLGSLDKSYWGRCRNRHLEQTVAALISSHLSYIVPQDGFSQSEYSRGGERDLDRVRPGYVVEVHPPS